MSTTTEIELEIAIQEVKADLASGQYVKESIAEHMDRVTDDV